MQFSRIALGAALALAAVSAAIAGGGPTEGPAPPAPTAHRFVAAPGQEREGIIGYVDMASLRRTGNTAEAEGILVPTQDTAPYPNYVIGHMRVDCVTRLASVTGTREMTLGGADAGPAEADMEPETLSHTALEEAFFALFCTAHAADSLPSFPTAAAAAASARARSSRT